MPVDHTLAEVLSVLADGVREELHKAYPATVTAWDPVTDTIVAKPAIKRPLFDDEDGVTYEELPEIPFVAVQRPRAGGYVVTSPILPGDTVLLVFTDFSLAEWRANGEVAEPADVRAHAPGWPIAILGVFPDSTPLSPLDVAARALGMIIGRDGQPEQIRVQTGLIQIGHTPFGAPIEVGPTGIALGGVAAIDHVALATPTNAGLAGVQAAIVAVAAYLAALKTAFDAHIHSGVTTGPGNSGAPTAPLGAAPAAPSAPAAVDATLVKAV